MSPSIEQLDRFVRSARAGSYSAAAQELYVTPQTVSKSVHDMEHKLNDQDLLKIQKEMKKIIQANYPLERFELPREEAIKFMADKGEDYKVELIEVLPEDGEISFYQQCEFVDLCAGPDVKSTNDVGMAF